MTIELAKLLVEANLELVNGGRDGYCDWRDESIDTLINNGMSLQDAENFVESL